MYEKLQEKANGVSPVIGVILLVAVTVALVALATVIVFDIGSDVSDTADATVQLEQVSVSDGASGSVSGIQATVIRNENVESFNLTGSIDSNMDGVVTITLGTSGSGDAYTYPDDASMTSVGETALYPANVTDTSGPTEYSLSDGDTISVIANLEDGSSEVLTSTDFESP